MLLLVTFGLKVSFRKVSIFLSSPRPYLLQFLQSLHDQIELYNQADLIHDNVQSQIM